LNLRKKDNLQGKFKLGLLGYIKQEQEAQLYTEPIDKLSNYFDGIIYMDTTNASEHFID